MAKAENGHGGRRAPAAALRAGRGGARRFCFEDEAGMAWAVDEDLTYVGDGRALPRLVLGPRRAGHGADTRMRLSMEGAARLLPLLERFARTGALEGRPGWPPGAAPSGPRRGAAAREARLARAAGIGHHGAEGSDQ